MPFQTGRLQTRNFSEAACDQWLLTHYVAKTGDSKFGNWMICALGALQAKACREKTPARQELSHEAL